MGWLPVLYYTNSNIWPEAEYDKRHAELAKVADHYGLELYKGSWDHAAWLEAVKGHEADKEGQGRCALCFAFNLSRAAAAAKELGIGHFTTTLTVSRFKKSATIFAVGDAFEGFEEIDFKKKDGFNRSIQLSKELGLYRQEYCGCEFSMRRDDA